jgi:thiol-disulfide isomerase/thioredoxin
MYSETNSSAEWSTLNEIEAFEVRFMQRLSKSVPCLILGAFILFSISPVAHAAYQGVSEKASRAGKFKSMIGEYERRYREYIEASESAETDAQRAVAEKRKPSHTEFGKQLLGFVKEAPGDAVSFDALVWVLENLNSADSTAQLDEAVGLFEKQHLKSPRLKTALPVLAACVSEKAELLLERLGETGETREIRGLALFHLAVGRSARYDGKDKKRLASIEKMLDRVQKDYGNVQPDDEEKSLGKLAEGALFAVRYLRPGLVVPDVDGAAVAGKPFKLSSFRGKVVLLVFWGTWCGPCMAKVPFERKLMEMYSGRPFTVVGVNCGDEKSKAASVMKEQKMGWPSFFDGEDGPIVTRWNITVFPTVFLIDAQGIIRLKDTPDDAELESAIAEALKQAEGK